MPVRNHTKQLINNNPYYADMAICPIDYHGYKLTKENLKQVIEEIEYEISVYPENCDKLLDQINSLKAKVGKSYQTPRRRRGGLMNQEDTADFKLLEEYDLKDNIAKMVKHVLSKMSEGNREQFLVNFINSLLGSAILHHDNKYVKKLQVPEFKETFGK